MFQFLPIGLYPVVQHGVQHKQKTAFIDMVVSVALSALAWMSAKSLDNHSAGAALLLRCVPGALSLIWLFKYFFSSNQPQKQMVYQGVLQPPPPANQYWNWNYWFPKKLNPAPVYHYPGAPHKPPFPNVQPALAQPVVVPPLNVAAHGHGPGGGFANTKKTQAPGPVLQHYPPPPVVAQPMQGAPVVHGHGGFSNFKKAHPQSPGPFPNVQHQPAQPAFGQHLNQPPKVHGGQGGGGSLMGGSKPLNVAPPGHPGVQAQAKGQPILFPAKQNH